MEDSVLLDEYCDKISYLKFFFLGESYLTNKQFFLVIKNLFLEKYSNKIIDFNKISMETNVEIEDIKMIYENLTDGNEISSGDFDIFRNIINVNDKTEEEKNEIIEKILFSSESNKKLFIDFKPSDILSTSGMKNLEKYINKILFSDKIKSILRELEIVLNPVYISNYEQIEFLDKYKNKFKRDTTFKKLQEQNIFLVKEEGEFLKLYDVNTLMPAFNKNIKINKKMVSRTPIEKEIFLPKKFN